jgi:hypothetical protein
LTKLATLPTPRFELTKWNSFQFSGTDGEKSHDIRIVPFDFSGDGLMDAIEISRPWFTNGQWPEYSEIQFLLNKGKGQFEDVTDKKLIGYNNASSASYQPQFIDANQDGRVDIFLSGSDFSTYNSTCLLLQQADGTFVESGRDLFSNLWKDALAKVKQHVFTWIFNDHGQTMHLVNGLNQQVQVVGTVAYQNSTGGLSHDVYLSNLSFSGEVLNERLFNTAGSDVWDGGLGMDSLIYFHPSSAFTLTRTNSSTWTILDKSIASTIDTVRNIERLQFTDKSIAFDLDGNAGTTAKILGAVFGKDSLIQQNYVGIGLSLLDQGMSYDTLSSLALDAANVRSPLQIVNLLWNNVMGIKASDSDLAPYIRLLENGMTPGALVHLAADSAFNLANINLVGLAATGIDYAPVAVLN